LPLAQNGAKRSSMTEPVAPGRKQSPPRSAKKELDRDLVAASREFAVESKARSWWHLFETLTVLAGFTAVAALPFSPWIRIASSVLAGLVWVRGFILFHDFMHGAILRQSTPAKWIMYGFGLLVLTPPNVWRQTHNYHHAHNAKIVGSHVGSFLTVTVDMWRAMKPRQRFYYRLVRSPLLIAAGYLTVFVFGMCVASFVRNPRKCWDSLLALVLHAGLLVGLWVLVDPFTMLCALLLPLLVAHALGAYLFYAQHNFVGVHLQPRHEWNFTRSAIASSSYMKLPGLMHWFTGNIGYHNVHHLNHRIPFYRLPEALEALEPLHQSPTTTLRPWDVAACLRLKVWDPHQERMLSFKELQAALQTSAASA